MKNISARESGAPGRSGVSPSPGLRRLRACEDRIGDLQSQQFPHDREGAWRRDARLRTEVDAAVRLARVCAAEGDWQQATPAQLAGMANGFFQAVPGPGYPGYRSHHGLYAPGGDPARIRGAP